MDSSGLRFYPGMESTPAQPLARFLPPLPAGMVSGWLKENVEPGGWLLDPLGASPALALEAARAGYRVIVACNNPILSFMIETLAGAPHTAEIQSALAELAVTRRGDERLEKHIQALYLTECESCGEQVPASAFLWRKGEMQPYARLYRCPRCNEAPSGERPVTRADLERLQGMGGDRLQRARALQRVILNDQDHRADVEEALESYLARPLYVLFTLLNKVEGLGLPPERARLLQALLISAFDAGSTLWPWPGGRSRPRQLTVPPQFRENNLWAALEEAAALWVAPGAPVPVTRWPNLPGPDGPGGAICLFRGRVKALMPLPPEIQLQAVVTAFPRPNQAFWTLSALWTGWLWGAEAALPLRNVLERRRYDWNWHTSAMHSALSAVGWNLPAAVPFFGILSDLAPGFLCAAVVACQAAGFDLEGLAMRGEQELAQGLWRPSQRAGSLVNREADTAEPAAPALDQTARAALRADLLARMEPAPYLTEYAAGLAALAQTGIVPRSQASLPGDLLTRIQAVLARTFADRSFLKLYGGPAEEAGWWWLAAPESSQELPLADRVEVETVRFMQRQPVFEFSELEQALCSQFTGLLAPSPELVRVCLESYGERAQEGSQAWQMQPSETAAARRTDLLEMRTLLEKVGRHLGMQVTQAGSALVWTDAGGSETWRFFLMASSLISRYVLSPPPSPPARMVLVLPGGRARLLALKLRRDPRLAEAARGWPVLKFRHLREIASRADLTPELFEALLDEDPLTDEATQMRLFSTL